MDREITGIRFVMHIKPALQNFLHIPVFTAFSILLLQVLKGYTMSTAKRVSLLLVIAVVFGIINEMIQAIIPGRYAGLEDMLLNLMGVSLGFLLYAILLRSRSNVLSRLICG